MNLWTGTAMETSLRLDPQTEKRLEQLARSTGRTKTWFIRRAIEEYLDEWEDYHVALTRLEQEKDEVDIADVRRWLGPEG